MDWLHKNFDGRIRTAQKYMRIARNWVELEKLLEKHPTLTIDECLDELRSEQDYDDEQEWLRFVEQNTRAHNEAELASDPPVKLPPQVAHVRMVQLFFNTTTLGPFQQKIEYLGKKYGTQNMTETVEKSIETLYEIEKRKEGELDPEAEEAGGAEDETGEQ
jgi:hypothetical protein